MAGFSANFGENKKGLSNIQWAWLDEDGNVIGSWTVVDGELQTNSGIYYFVATPPASAYWVAFRTNDTDELFLVSGLQEKGIVFYFGEVHSGKNISYQYYTDINNPTGPVITTDIIEFMSTSGIYLPLNVSIPINATFIKAWTDDTTPVYIAGAIDFDVTIYTQVPRTGPTQEEVEV
jgi:hypothetical protein